MTFSPELVWWVTAIELPILAGLFWLIWRTRQEHEETCRHLRELVDARHAQLREALANYKLEVAKNYAALSDLKELELRLVSHLLRIEAKLDKTAMKTEALGAHKRTYEKE